MTLLFATVEDDDIYQKLFMLLIRFMLSCRNMVFEGPYYPFRAFNSCCSTDIYKLDWKPSCFSPDLSVILGIKDLCECVVCVCLEAYICSPSSVRPFVIHRSLTLSSISTHFPFLPHFKSQSLVLLNISVNQAGGGDLLIRFPWLLWLPFSIIRYTTWPKILGYGKAFLCLTLSTGLVFYCKSEFRDNLAQERAGTPNCVL